MGSNKCENNPGMGQLIQAAMQRQFVEATIRARDSYPPNIDQARHDVPADRNYNFFYTKTTTRVGDRFDKDNVCLSRDAKPSWTAVTQEDASTRAFASIHLNFCHKAQRYGLTAYRDGSIELGSWEREWGNSHFATVSKDGEVRLRRQEDRAEAIEALGHAIHDILGIKNDACASLHISGRLFLGIFFDKNLETEI